MITLKTEFQKIKRRKIGLTIFALLGMQFAWILWTAKSANEKDPTQGWLNLLHTLPLLNVIMMPTIMAVLASRLSDLEHKGNTYKLLRTLRRPGILFNAKVLCGLLYTGIISVIQVSSLLALGYSQHYAGAPDMYYYMLTFILEFACCFSLYLLQLNLSLLFFNQMIPLVVGLCGSLLGLVLMYIKMYSFLPWGGFLSCALVGMDWNVETRVVTYFYREHSTVELCAVGMVFIWIVIFYVTGRIAFTRKEV